MSEVTPPATEREWLVLMRARSTIRFRSDPRLLITAGPASTGPVTAVRLRNAYSRPDGELLVTGLFVEARGTYDGPDTAIKHLASWAVPHLQVIATAANGAVDEPTEVLVYAPPVGDEVGRFVERRSCGPMYPAAVVRSITPEDLLVVLQGLEGHTDQERLQRAMAHYRQALADLDPLPFNRVECAESLFMACENLLQVILRRLYREASLPDSAASKHQLAVAAGFNPANEHSSSHLNEFDSYVRVTHIFDGDDEVYKRLKFASDHFEHGSRGFDKVQDAAETSADAAFRYVRRAILREIGIPADSPLFTDTKYDIPQPGWQPALQVTGSYASDVEEEWPHFYGMSIFPEVSRIVDIDDDQKRTVDFKLNASGAALLHGQTVTPESSLWIIPMTADRKFEQVGDPVMEFTHATETAAASEAVARVGFLRQLWRRFSGRRPPKP